MNKYIIYEIMKEEPTMEVGLMNTISILSNYDNVKLIQNEKNLQYQVDIDKLVSNEISYEELIDIRNGGWELSEKKDCLIKNI
jgi:hypothetical protein